MLAEKFFLVLETLRSHASDGGVEMVSASPHVPVKRHPSNNQEAASASTLGSVSELSGPS
jgi:hypothetical protein